jgi:hypothetical protein
MSAIVSRQGITLGGEFVLLWKKSGDNWKIDNRYVARAGPLRKGRAQADEQGVRVSGLLPETTLPVYLPLPGSHP